MWWEGTLIVRWHEWIVQRYFVAVFRVVVAVAVRACVCCSELTFCFHTPSTECSTEGVMRYLRYSAGGSGTAGGGQEEVAGGFSEHRGGEPCDGCNVGCTPGCIARVDFRPRARLATGRTHPPHLRGVHGVEEQIGLSRLGAYIPRNIYHGRASDETVVLHMSKYPVRALCE